MFRFSHKIPPFRGVIGFLDIVVGFGSGIDGLVAVVKQLAHTPLKCKLFTNDPFFQLMIRIEQKGGPVLVTLAYSDGRHTENFHKIGSGCQRALAWIEVVECHLCSMRK